MVGADVRTTSSHDGGSMLGGPPRWVWHTYECGYNWSAERGARGLVSAGNECHFVFHPRTGAVAQVLPANRAGRGLRNLRGGVQTNRYGSVCLQVEVIGRARRPWTADLTSAGVEGLARLLEFGRSHGIPDVWPAGSPPAFVKRRGYWMNVPEPPRSVSAWTDEGGHFSHSQVPENTHGDPGAIDVGVMFAAGDGGVSVEEEDVVALEGLICYHPGDGALFLVAGGRAKYIPSMELARELAEHQTGQESLAADDLPKISGAVVEFLNSDPAN